MKPKSLESRKTIAPMLCLLTSVIATQAGAQHMPRGSYLKEPVSNANEIVGQIKSDPRLMERYTRVFNLPPQQVKAAVGQLRLTKLSADHVYKVYYVRKGEVLGYRLRTVKAGTSVFTLPDGTPALIKACGNPLRNDLSGALVKNTKVMEPEGDAETAQTVENLPTPSAEPTLTPRQPVTSLSTAAPTDMSSTQFTALPAGDVSDFVPDTNAGALGSLPKAAAAGNSLAAALTKGGLIAASLAAVGDWIAGGTHGGGSGGGGTIVTPVGPTTPINPYPGPGNNPPVPPNVGAVSLTPEWNSGTLFLCALGGLFLSGNLMRRRRTS